jgi:tight adherence protein B
VELLAIGTFVGVLAVFLGLYWALVLRQEDQDRAHLSKRMRAALGKGVARLQAGSLAKAEQQFSQVPLLNKILAHTRVTDPLQQLIDQAGSNLTVGLVVLMTGSAGVAGYLLVSILTGYRGLGLVAGILLSVLPLTWLKWQRNRRITQFEEKFPEAIDLIARALRAGHAFTTGLSMVADEIPDPVGAEFKLLYDRQNYGMPLPDALRNFAERIPLLDARFFATAVLTQREAGGNLSEVLDNLSKVVRERFKVKRQVRVITAHGRMTGAVLVALPPLTALGFLILVPSHIKLLVQDPMGIRLVVTALVLQVTGGLLIRKLVNIEY